MAASARSKLGTGEGNPSGRFRGELAHELPIWVQEGLVSSEEAESLVNRYRLRDLGSEGTQLALSVVFVLGGLLVGLGFVSFVAYNWAEIPRIAKSMLLVGGLVGLQATGYWLWFRKGYAGLGHALVFAACLLFGADIALMAQSFQVGGADYVGYAAWAVGALAVAFVVDSFPIGLIALGAAFYWLIGDVLSSALSTRGGDLSGIIANHVFAAVIFGLFACRKRSALFMVAAAYLWLQGSWIYCGYGLAAGSRPGFVSPAILLPEMAGWSVFLWAVGARLRSFPFSAKAALGLELVGFGSLVGLAYLFSFHGFWTGGAVPARAQDVVALEPLAAVSTAILLAVLMISSACRSGRLQDTPMQALWLALSGAGAFVAASLASFADVTGISAVAIMVLSTFLFGAAMIAHGLSVERRESYWVGTFYVVAVVLARLFEYETSLGIKALVFMVCGAALLAAGFMFERRIRLKEARQP